MYGDPCCRHNLTFQKVNNAYKQALQIANSTVLHDTLFTSQNIFFNTLNTVRDHITSSKQGDRSCLTAGLILIIFCFILLIAIHLKKNVTACLFRNTIQMIMASTFKNLFAKHQVVTNMYYFDVKILYIL